MKLTIEYSNKSILNNKLDALIVFIFEDLGLAGSGLNSLPYDLKNNLDTSIKLKVFTGKQNKCLQLFSAYANIPQILAVGVGKKNEMNSESLRRAAGTAGKILNSLKAKNIGFSVTSHLQKVSNTDVGQVLVEGLTLGSYKFNKYKESNDENLKLESIKLKCFDPDNVTSRKAIKTGKMRADSTNLARNLGNMPANDLKPKDLASSAEKIAKQHKMNCTVLEEKQMKKLGMEMLLGVSQGSREPAKLILMEYFHQKAKQTVALVGKGVTFDSGGISLKPGRNMDEMKFDMCGAAAVLGAMEIIGQINPHVNVIGVIAATENLPGGDAQRPGDIVTAHNGKRVEILNTDAEGRLILGDALSYVVNEFKPNAVIDLATLTGACITALGHYACGAITNSNKLMEQVRKAANLSGDRVWQLPCFPEYGESIKGKYGDLQNIGVGDSGTIIGGMFLEHFVDKTPWVHLDIAGTAWNVKHIGYQPNSGATGFGVRLLVDLVQNWEPI
ncbi:MAG: leucyl aminopeptidase [Deltaproteobacteria bacterium]|nr:leucyl aminopeptidase [Deltaproteobacteria bacterium]|tara:strand:+ start:144 stop:1646 length:1503 start_codon:yes stop_codon:yes gene_type:complete